MKLPAGLLKITISVANKNSLGKATDFTHEITGMILVRK
jgi:hypothetical protein